MALTHLATGVSLEGGWSGLWTASPTPSQASPPF